MFLDEVIKIQIIMMCMQGTTRYILQLSDGNNSGKRVIETVPRVDA